MILACFRDNESGQAFTIAQLLYLSADLTVQKTAAITSVTKEKP